MLRYAVILGVAGFAIGCGDDAALPGSARDSGAGDVVAPNDATLDGESEGAAADAPAADEPAADGTLVEREPDASDSSKDASPADVATADRASDAGADAADASAVVEAIQYYGRWNRLADRAITVNSGSHVVAQFTGTSLSARFDVSGNGMPVPTIAWRIDQGPWQESNVAASVMLAPVLTAAQHQVWLMARGFDETQSRWTPPLSASLTFLGFDVTGGAIQPSPRPAQRKVEFLGDSITEGVAIFSDRPNMTGASWRADGRIAYACQTALALGVDWRQVGFGRQGVTIVGNGGVPVAGQAFDWIYAGVPRDAWQADLVVINQGTNDGSAASDVFRPAYASFLAAVRKGYPQGWIAALRPFGGAHAADIQAEVAARTGAGDARIFFVDTTGWLLPADFTDGVHPNPQGSAKAAQQLVTELGKHPW